MAELTAEERAASLACWNGPVTVEPLGGGITNTNFIVTACGQKYVVRIGEDIPVHQISRTNELAAAKAAHAAGLSPEIVHVEARALVMRAVEGKTYDEGDVRDSEKLARILEVVRRCHLRIPDYFRGTASIFWVFQVLRDYSHTLRDDNSRYLTALPRLSTMADSLHAAVGPIDIVFGHNDLLAANFIDDGDKLWLIDWEYAGFNSPLFDLGGLASNNLLSTEQETWLLENYFERPLDEALNHRYTAMKCASLLREAMWSMVQEIHSPLDVDYAAYTGENLERLDKAWQDFRQL